MFIFHRRMGNIVNIYGPLEEETWKLAEEGFQYCSKDCEHLLS